MTAEVFSPAQDIAPLVAALATANSDPRDFAAYQLAYRLAVEVDRAHYSVEYGDGPLPQLAAKLLSALDALGATPKSRSTLRSGQAAKPSEPVSPLARLRAVHSDRLAFAPAFDGAAATTNS